MAQPLSSSTAWNIRTGDAVSDVRTQRAHCSLRRVAGRHEVVANGEIARPGVDIRIGIGLQQPPSSSLSRHWVCQPESGPRQHCAEPLWSRPRRPHSITNVWPGTTPPDDADGHSPPDTPASRWRRQDGTCVRARVAGGPGRRLQPLRRHPNMQGRIAFSDPAPPHASVLRPRHPARSLLLQHARLGESTWRSTVLGSKLRLSP